MKLSSSKARMIASISQYIVLAIVSIIMLTPLLFLVNTSLKSVEAFISNPVGLFQLEANFSIFSNYLYALETMEIFSRLIYTVVMTGASAIITCIVVTLIAFPISRGHFKGSNKVLVFVLASTFFPGSLVANIFLVQNLGLFNNPITLLILWGLGGLPVYIFMMVQFLKAVPKELDEAAAMDGISYYKYIFTIVIPLTKPIFTTIFILKFIGSWNDFLTPYIYLQNDEFMTIATGLYKFKGQFMNNWPGLAAATLTVAIPVILLYGFMQRYIIDGISSGAVKG